MKIKRAFVFLGILVLLSVFLAGCDTPPPPTCTDSDGGLNYSLAGTAALSTGEESADYCLDQRILNEGYCMTGIGPTSYQQYTCPNECVDGECIPATVCGDWNDNPVECSRTDDALNCVYGQCYIAEDPRALPVSLGGTGRCHNAPDVLPLPEDSGLACSDEDKNSLESCNGFRYGDPPEQKCLWHGDPICGPIQYCTDRYLATGECIGSGECIEDTRNV